MERPANAAGLAAMLTLVSVVVLVCAQQSRDLLRAEKKDPEWQIEHDSTSSGTIAVEGSTLRFRYSLGPGRPSDQFVAIVKPLEGGVAAWNRLMLQATADRPLRMAIQLRSTASKNPPLWRRSVYLDGSPRTVTIPFSDMTPVAGGSGAVPLTEIGALLIGLDMVNTKPGTSGTVSFSEIALAR